MKLLNIKGKLVNVSIKPSDYPVKIKSRSKLQGIVGQYLVENFPNEPILEDFTVPGSRLSVDFFLPKSFLAIEVNPYESGHTEHSAFFHGQPGNHKFVKQVVRDGDKALWCEMNGFELVVIKEESDIIQLH